MRLCFFSGKVGDYKVLFVATRKCRSTPDGRWYFSLLFEYPKQEIPKKTAGKGPEAWEAIGLDMSLPELYVDSDGNTPAYPKPYRKL